MDPLFSVEEMAHYLSMKKSRIYNLIFKKQIPYIKIGSSVRFKPEEILKWLDGQGGQIAAGGNG